VADVTSSSKQTQWKSFTAAFGGGRVPQQDTAPLSIPCRKLPLYQFHVSRGMQFAYILIKRNIRRVWFNFIMPLGKD